MKIAVVLHTFPVVSETFIVNQICALIDNNHEVTILALYKGTPTIIHKKITDYQLLNKVKYYNTIPVNKLKRLGLGIKLFFKNGSFSKLLKTINIFKHGMKVLNLERFYRAQWFFKKNEFDVIHCHFAQLGLFIAKLKKDGLLDNEKLITTFHGVDIAPEHIAKYQKSYQVLFEHMNTCTYNSEYSLKILKKINNNYVAYKFLPVGLDTSLFRPQHKKEQDKTINILFCGRLVPFKGPDIAIKIVQELLKNRSSKIHLTIIGNGGMIDFLKKTIKENNLERYITLKGSLSQEQIIDAMNQSDIFLLPGIVDSKGRAENQGLVIQEAQSMELPVVVSDAGGMKYGLVDEVTGFVVKSKNIKLFAKKIGLLIDDKQFRIKMGKAGRNHVVKTYDNQVLYQKLMSYYENA